MLFIHTMTKLSLLQSLVSRDQIILTFWFGAQQAFLIIVNVESSCAA